MISTTPNELYLLIGQRDKRLNENWPTIKPFVFGQLGNCAKLGLEVKFSAAKRLTISRNGPGATHCYLLKTKNYLLLSTDLTWLTNRFRLALEKPLLPWLVMLGSLPPDKTIFHNLLALPADQKWQIKLGEKPLIELANKTPAESNGQITGDPDLEQLQKLLSGEIKKAYRPLKNKARGVAFGGGLPSAYLLSCFPAKNSLNVFTMTGIHADPQFDQTLPLNCCRHTFKKFVFQTVSPDLTALAKLAESSALPPLTMESALMGQLAQAAAADGVSHLFSGLGGAELFGRTPLQLFKAQTALGRPLKQVTAQFPPTSWLKMIQLQAAQKRRWLLPNTINCLPSRLLNILEPSGQFSNDAGENYQRPLAFLGAAGTSSGNMADLWQLLYRWELNGRHELCCQLCKNNNITLVTPFMGARVIHTITAYPWEKHFKNGIPGSLLTPLASGRVPDQLLMKRHIYPQLPLAQIIPSAAFSKLAAMALDSSLWQMGLFKRQSYLELLASRQEPRLLWALTMLAIWIEGKKY